MNTRKKVIKTVYKNELSDEEEGGDFSDSGSDAKISAASSSEDEEIHSEHSSADEFDQKPKKKSLSLKNPPKKPKFAKAFVKKINKQRSGGSDGEHVDVTPAFFSIKDLTEADKLLPSILNLSESDSSDEESPTTSGKSNNVSFQTTEQKNDSDDEAGMEYKDVWSNNIQEPDNSEEIAKKTFMELEKHKSRIEEAKVSLQNYAMKMQEQESDVKDLLALGEEVMPTPGPTVSKKPKARKRKDDSDSEMEDWEEVKETKEIPQQGLQLFVEFPDAVKRKSKKTDVEMMLKRRMNRVKKEYQVYMHKVHVLCWLGHGNYVSRVINDQEILAAALSLVPSKECYPEERVHMKYVEQITTWYKDKLTLKLDKNEDKFRPKAPPLKTILLDLIKRKVVTSKKYLVFIFVAMLRALGVQCRVMFNFVTLPLKPPAFELCSLSTKSSKEKATDEKGKSNENAKPASTKKEKDSAVNKKGQSDPKPSTSKVKSKKTKIAQVDGNYDSCSSTDDEAMQVDWHDDRLLCNDFDNIMQVDGNDDALTTKKTRSTKRPNTEAADKQEDVSPPKIAKKTTGRKSPKPPVKSDGDKNITLKTDSRTRAQKNNTSTTNTGSNSKSNIPEITVTKADDNETKNLDKSSDKTKSRTRAQKNNTSTTNSGSNGKNKIPEITVTNADNNETGNLNKSIEKTNSRTRSQKNNSSTTKSVSPSTTKMSAKSTDNNETRKLDKSIEKTNSRTRAQKNNTSTTNPVSGTKSSAPKTSTTKEIKVEVSSKYFETKTSPKLSLSRNRSNPSTPKNINKSEEIETSSPNSSIGSLPSKYFGKTKPEETTRKNLVRMAKEALQDKHRVSHRDLAKTSPKANNDVTGDLVDIMRNRIKAAKSDAKKGLVKGKIKQESDEDSDYLPVEDSKRNTDSDDDFKPTKLSPKPRQVTKVKIDRRVLSSSSPDEEPYKKNKVDVWCEIYVEELEQWISVDVIKGKIHSTDNLYTNCTHPVAYVVGWDNNNYLKDLTRKYVPQYNTVTRKLRAEPSWWDKAVRPYLGPKNARDREEDEYLDRMQLEAPLPKSIAEYKNHPLYALQRHLLKFEAIYPPDAAILGYVRGEAVYARECVYTCRSRDTWLKEAKVVKLAQQPYKVVKARPKWDKLSNKLITDKPLEVFGPWQVQDYEPPTAENGIVPRNAYGNVELFKACMLPKGTVHIKLPGLNKVAKKLNVDCAPAMTGFDFNGGWSHPVYDGFVVCQEFEQAIIEAWELEQEEQERKELEKIEVRVYGNWKRLIKGLLIRERLKNKYGFEEPSTSEAKGKAKGPKFVAKKK